MKCHHCQTDAVYKCSVCDHLLCTEHTIVRTVCPECSEKTRLTFTIERTAIEDREEIREIVRRFWREEEQLTFDLRLKVAELPGYSARIKKKLVGFVSAVESSEEVIISALGVLPQYQGSGIGKKLIRRVEEEAISKGKKRLLVSTSNDDLPALGFYQSLGFQLYEVKPDAILEKHGKILEGIGKLPIRDELRLRKIL